MLRRLLRQWESPPTWLILFLVLAAAQSRYLPALPTGGPLRLAGLLLIVAGAVLLAVAAAAFRRHQTTILPREVPSALITGGVYAWSRNPIYLADAMILAGAALWWDAAALLLVPLFVWVITRRFILGEEAGLRAAFGPAFDLWAARTGRWFGRRRPGAGRKSGV